MNNFCIILGYFFKTVPCQYGLYRYKYPEVTLYKNKLFNYKYLSFNFLLSLDMML